MHQEVSLQHEEEILYVQVDVAPEQAACGGHGAFLSVEIPNPPAHVPVSPALGDPALAGDLD